MFELVNQTLTKVKRQNPLILNITNHVTIDFIANGLLSMGASPMMSFAKKEMDDLIKISNAIVINLGTLDDNFNELCHHVCKVANQHNKLIILDPVGAGASHYRTQTSLNLLEHYKISILRANAGEVMALSGIHLQTKGVDSHAQSTDAIEIAQLISKKYDIAVCMSGKFDFVIDNDKNNKLSRGSALMPLVTGTGCLLSSIVAAFNAVNENRFEAASAASLFYSVCGEIAEKKSGGPASFKINFIDTLNASPVAKDYE